MTTPLKILEWESKSALLAHLQGTAKFTVIGIKAQAPAKFYSCAISQAPAVEVGIFSSGLGITPSGFLLADRALIGHDACITCLKTSDVYELFSKNAPGVVYELIPIESGHFVIVHELGALRIDPEGEVVWNVDTDVISDFYVDSGCLVLKTMDEGVAVHVVLLTGALERKRD